MCATIEYMAKMNDPLESIVGDALRVKMLRVFVLNPETVYTVKEFMKVFRKREPAVRETLKWLDQDGIIKKKKIPQARRKNEGIRETVGFGFNKRYAHQEFLEKIIRDSIPTERDIVAKKLSRAPGVQCVITVDIFVDNPEREVDVVVASSQKNDAILRSLIQETEQEVGRELRCAFLTVNDLIHRIQTNDRFIRAVLDGQHRVHIDKIGIFR